MRTLWTNLIRSDCKVIMIGKDYIYPIFKCGSTTLFVNADQILVNEELQNLSTIKMLISFILLVQNICICVIVYLYLHSIKQKNK